MEIQASIEGKGNELTPEELFEIDDKFFSILSDIVFNGQFTLEQMYEGADEEYLKKKMAEALYGIKDEEESE